MQQKSERQAPYDLFTRTLLPFCPSNIQELDEERQRAYHAVVAFIYIGATIIFGFATLNIKHHNYTAGGIQYVTVGIVLAMLLANRRGYSTLAAHTCVAMTTVTVFIGMWTGGGLSAAAIVFLPMIPAVGFLSVGNSGGIAGMIQAVLAVVLVAVCEKLGFEPRHDPPDKLFVKRLAESIAVVMQIFLVCWSFFKLKTDAFKMLSSKRDELAGLFDNMRQGVLAFGADGKVTGQYSEKAKAIFKRPALDGVEVAALLYGDSPAFDLGRQEFLTWLESVFMAASAELGDMLSLAPEHCVLAAGTYQEQHLRLEFRPIMSEGALERVMLLVSDETEQVLLRRAADEQKLAGERALDRMRRMAAGGAYAFLETLRSAEGRLELIRRDFEAGGEALRMAEIDVMFRAAHTIKGEARLYDLDRLGLVSEQLEELLAELRGQVSAGTCVVPAQVAPRALALLDEARDAIELARGTLVAASPIGAAILDQVTVRETDLRALRQQVMRMHMTLGEEATPLSELTSRLLARPFGESAAGLADAVERWSAQQGKRALAALSGKEVSVTPELHEVLPGVLGHLVRNAVAHGIELPDDRLRTGKPERGTVRIQCEASPLGPCITIEDDGAGVDVAQLRMRADQLGMSWDGQSPLELMFVDGLSTAEQVDALSGRGVGMSAVRADLLGVGYVIEASTELGRGTKFLLRPACKHDRGKAA